MSSPGKRKLEVMMSKNKTSLVHELIENFEVGNQTKRKKKERDSSCSLNQPHLNLNFRRGKIEAKNHNILKDFFGLILGFP